MLNPEIKRFPCRPGLIILLILLVAPVNVLLAQVHVSDAWSMPLPPTAVNGAAYLTLMNHGAEPVRLTGASTGKAGSVEIHTHLHENGQMMMKRLDDLELAPGETAVFAPGGLHLMLMGLGSPLVTGDRYRLTLEFAGSGPLTVEVRVEDMSTGAGGHEGHSMD